jgi:hypothetical protein
MENRESLIFIIIKKIITKFVNASGKLKFNIIKYFVINLFNV